MAEVKAVCISERKGTMKHEVPEIRVKIKHGIEGDAHAGDWHRHKAPGGRGAARGDADRQGVPHGLRYPQASRRLRHAARGRFYGGSRGRHDKGRR